MADGDLQWEDKVGDQYNNKGLKLFTDINL